MPSFLRKLPSCRSGSRVMSSPSTHTSPVVGLWRPMKCLINTLFPQPEGPMMAQVSPFTISRSTPRSTSFPPRVFRSWRTEIMLSNAAGKDHVEREGQEEIQDQDGQRTDHHRFRGRAPHADGAILRIQALMAGDEDNGDAE